MKKVGSRAQVYHGNAVQTSGGLKKRDLFKDRHGCIKSKRASNRARKNKNLGKLLKQKGSGCFDYTKTMKTQLGGGKNKKNVELEKHIFLFSNGMPTFTLPNHYKNAKLGYKCDCPLQKLIKHTVGDHVEFDDMAMMEDSDMGFLLPSKCHFNNKQQDKLCDCGFVKKPHKIKDHIKSTKKSTKKSKKKSKKGGGIGSLFAKVASKAKAAAPAFQKLAAKGTAVAQKAAVKGQALAEKAKKFDLDSAMNKIEQVGNRVDMASQALGQVQGAVGQVQQQGQQLVGQVGQLGQQVMATPQLMVQQPQQMLVPQQPQMMMVPVQGGKKKKSKKRSSKKKH